MKRMSFWISNRYDRTVQPPSEHDMVDFCL